MINSHIVLLTASVLVVCGVFSEAQADGGFVPAPSEFSKVRKYIQRSIVDGLAPSVAVAVVRDDNVIWAEGFGFADLERKKAATPNSIYRLASISKPITATGLMILVDRGQLDLDAPANRYLPAAKLRSHFGSADAITLRRLANHTSGLPIHYNFYYPGTRALSVDQAIGRYGFTATKPGTRWEYSNLAFGVLNYVTEVAAETPWAEYMRREVYDRIGMTRTDAGVRLDYEADATVQYARDVAGRYYAIPRYTFDHPGASAVWSSALDMARFARLHLNRGQLNGVRILSEETARQMQVQTADRTEQSGTGIGWAVGEFYGRRSIWHSGGMPGVATHLHLYLKDRCATVVLTNTDNAAVRVEVTNRLAGVLFPDAPVTAPEPVPDEQPTAEPSGWRGNWAGTISHQHGDIPLQIEFRASGNVRVRVGRSPLWTMNGPVFLGDGEFRGTITVRLPTQRGYHGIPLLEFRLHRDEDRLTGAAVALAEGYFALSHWVELKRD
jgi:CubicO group peptidase (beta-lactamase class C family)